MHFQNSGERDTRIQRLHVSFRVTIALGSVCLVGNVSNSLRILRRELDPPSVHILLEVLQNCHHLSGVPVPARS